jgi:hypothetical protein
LSQYPYFIAHSIPQWTTIQHCTPHIFISISLISILEYHPLWLIVRILVWEMLHLLVPSRLCAWIICFSWLSQNVLPQIQSIRCCPYPLIVILTIRNWRIPVFWIRCWHYCVSSSNSVLWWLHPYNILYHTLSLFCFQTLQLCHWLILRQSIHKKQLSLFSPNAFPFLLSHFWLLIKCLQLLMCHNLYCTLTSLLLYFYYLWVDLINSRRILAHLS